MTAALTSRSVREQLGHPVIDADGHLQEMTGFLRDEIVEYAREVGGDALLEKVSRSPLTHDDEFLRRWFDMGDDSRRDRWEPCVAWWALPTRTVDRAMAYLPGLLAEHLEVMGIDYAVLYPSMGLALGALPDPEVRQAACRVYNKLHAELYKPYADRLTPTAIIPMVTPAEALSELDYAVGTLGLKAVVMTTVRRPIAAVERTNPELASYAFRMDTFGIDSPYDYDPLWQRCSELGVSVGFHSGEQGIFSRRSISRYSYNHIGCFAAASESISKSLFFGGVTKRFPKLNFAFLEGGVAWACTLLSDMIGHWEKRGAHSIGVLDPSNLDIDAVESLFERYAPPQYRDRLDEIRPFFSRPQPRPRQLDDWRDCGIESVDDIVSQFTSRFYFGCEADDPMNALAFDTKMNAQGAKLRAIFGSDIGHWDVTNVDDVLVEAYELVEHGTMSEADLRSFLFGNGARFYAENNPAFFDGTRIESAVRAELSV